MSREEFRQALQRAGFGLGADLAFHYDARYDETVWTVWTVNGQPVGLTSGRIGARTACFLATPAIRTSTASCGPLTEPPAVAVHSQAAAVDANNSGQTA